MQYQKPALLQEQKLKLSPQMLQSIQLMALPVTELKLRIAEELEKNPALEVVDDPSQVSYDEIDGASSASEEYDYFENSSDPGYTSGYDSEASDAKQKFLEGAIAQPESLQEHLMWQLRLLPVDDVLFAAAEQLIMNLDENGFHIEDPFELLPDAAPELVEKAIALVQRFDPAGVCAADYKESLLVQIAQDPEAPSEASAIVRDLLPRLEKNRIGEIAGELNITHEQAEAAAQYIRRLTPFPGRLYSRETPHYVIPDVSVRLEEGEFKIYINDMELPVLGVSPFFTSLQEAPKEGGADTSSARKFAVDYVKEAEWFINSIGQRNRSLFKITRAVVEFQRDFFLKGPKFLVPLTLKDIADEVSVHETTVSRISNAKYMQTEWGIYPIKYFFTNSISGAGSGGSRFSKGGVKEMVREILESDTGGKRLSDQKISEILKTKGVSIARRTVAKYRNELNIDSSFER